MTAAYLSKVGNDLVKRCETRDPFRIARELGIEVLFCEDFGPLKGMYRVIKRNRFIFINKDLSPRMQTIVCAHEISLWETTRGFESLPLRTHKKARNKSFQGFFCAQNRVLPKI